MTAGKRPIVLPTYDGSDERTLRTHIRLMHAIHVNDEKTIAGLVACHEHEHDPRNTPIGRPIRHEHSADPRMDELEEWQW